MRNLLLFFPNWATPQLLKIYHRHYMKRKGTESISARRKVRRTTQESVSSAVQRELRKKADWKYCDTFYGPSSSTSSGNVISLTGSLSRGDAGIDNFSGNWINPAGLTVKYTFDTNQTFNRVRIMIIQWYDGGAPSIAGLLASTSVPYATLCPTYATNTQTIKVLYDRTHVIAPTAGGDTTPIGLGVVTGKAYISGKKMRKIRFPVSTTTPQYGGLYLIHISDDSLTSFPNCTFVSRLTFTDE